MQSSSLADEIRHFLWHKVKGILPYHFAFAALYVVEVLLFYSDNILKRILVRIPSLFYLHMFGFSSDAFIPVEWYVSSMLIAMAILYPLCKKYYTSFTHFWGAFGAFCILGYMYKCQGMLSGPHEITGFTYQGNWRAVAEISLGMCSFEICRWMENRTFTSRQRLLLSLTEGCCYVLVFLYIISTLSAKYDIVALLLLWTAVTISFSQKGLLGYSKLFQNSFCNWLGAVSLPIYLCQNVVRTLFNNCYADMRGRMRLLLCVASVLILGVFAYYIRTIVGKQWAKTRIASQE